MDRLKRLFSCGTLLTILIICSCECKFLSDTYSYFEYDLCGTWVSNDPSVYSGKLIIDFDRIIIAGFSEYQTPFKGDDGKRPFKDYTKNVPLRGYSEFGKIYIIDGGQLKEGIPYTIYTTGYSGEKILRFFFGERVETMQQCY